MIAYHVDRSCMLQPNQIIKLFENIKLNNVFNDYNNSFSNHGLQYLNQYSDSAIWELCLEFIRSKHFPDYPSRLQCFYGVKSLEDALIWKEYISNITNSNVNICKIEFSKSFEFDARWMTTPPKLAVSNGNFNFNNKSIAKILDYCYKYWNKEISHQPLNELLIIPPVKIIEIL